MSAFIIALLSAFLYLNFVEIPLAQFLLAKHLPKSSKKISGFTDEKILPIDDVVKEYAEKVVKLLGGNRSKASEALGISRTSLWKILKEE